MLESGFSDFMAQVPPIIFIMLCGSGILLIVSVIGIISARGRRSRDVAAPPPSPLMAVAPPDAASGDLPDLDMLLNMTAPAPVEGAKNAPPTPVASSVPAPAAPPARRTGTYAVQLGGRMVEAAEVMLVSRDLADGSLIIQIGDHAYGSAAEITDPEVRRRFAATMRELVRLSSDPGKAAAPRPAAESAPPAPPPVAQSPVMEAPAPTAPPVPPAPPNPTAPPPRPPATGVPLPGDLPKFSTSDPIPTSRRERREAIKQPIPEINIAGAIETYLQFKLMQTPEYAGRRIHVHPAPGGGVAIEVDGRMYEAVGDVEDPAVRAFLAATIQEWQDRQ